MAQNGTQAYKYVKRVTWQPKRNDPRDHREVLVHHEVARQSRAPHRALQVLGDGVDPREYRDKTGENGTSPAADDGGHDPAVSDPLVVE